MKKIFVYGMAILSVLTFFSFSGAAFAQETETGGKNYVLIFQNLEYDKRIGDAVDYFLKEVLKPADYLLLLTPMKPYSFSQKTRETTPLEKLSEITKDVLKRDISMEATTYTDIIQQMEIVVRSFSDPNIAQPKSLITQYRQLKENLFSIRKLNEKLFLDLAAKFKQAKGETHIIIFYEKRIRVIPNRQTMDRLRGNAEVRFDVNEVLESESGAEVMNVETVSQALKDAAIRLDFVYLNTRMKQSREMEVKEFSGDIYNVFSKIAKETGGTVMIASRTDAALKEIIGEKK